MSANNEPGEGAPVVAIHGLQDFRQASGPMFSIGAMLAQIGRLKACFRGIDACFRGIDADTLEEARDLRPGSRGSLPIVQAK